MAVSDNFNRADENPLGNSVWTTQTGASGPMKIVSQQAKGHALAANVSYYSGATFADDHYSQCIVPTNGDGGPTVRNAAAAYSYYALVVAASSITFGKRVAGAWSTIGSAYSYSLSASEVVKLSVTGTTFTLYIDGVEKTTWTDSSLSSGYAGIQCYGTTTILDDWGGGNVSAGGGGTSIVGTLGLLGIGI